MKERAKLGDVFCAELKNGQFMFGQVMLDIEMQCVRSKRIIKTESLLRFWENGYVVRVFEEISSEPGLNSWDILVSGIPVDPRSFADDTWKVIDHHEQNVGPQFLEFSENYSLDKGEVVFEKGEVSVRTNLSEDDFYEYELEGGAMMNSSLLFDTALIMLDRQDLSDAPWAEPIVEYDKRYIDPQIRARVFEGLGLSPDISYYDFALKYGFDTARFFE